MSSRFYDWVDSRTGFVTFMRHKMGQAVPSDAFFFCFGGISLVIILMQLLTGIFLIFFYMPNPEFALQSIERMSNEITGGSHSHR